MQIVTLEDRFFKRNPKGLYTRIYVIRKDNQHFVTGDVEELKRNGTIVEATLYPWVSLDTGGPGFLSGHNLQGSLEESLTIELEEESDALTRYVLLTMSYDAHKRQTDRIISNLLQNIPREGRKSTISKDYQSYLDSSRELP